MEGYKGKRVRGLLGVRARVSVRAAHVVEAEQAVSLAAERVS